MFSARVQYSAMRTVYSIVFAKNTAVLLLLTPFMRDPHPTTQNTAASELLIVDKADRGEGRDGAAQSERAVVHVDRVAHNLAVVVSVTESVESEARTLTEQKRKKAGETHREKK
jgi:hypothetical protein